MIKKSIAILLGILHFFFISHVYGQEEIDEDDLFSDSESIVNLEEMMDESIESTLDARSLSFSGSLYNTSTCYAKPDNFALKQYLVSIEDAGTDSQGLNTDAISQTPFDTENNTYFSTTMTSNILLDARLSGGIKGFINLDVCYYPQGQTDYTGLTDGSFDATSSDEELYTDYIIKEAFADINISRKVYFRLGKQVLKWGRGNFFNPTDLINVEKKSIMDMDASMSMDTSREGTYGLKMHIPFGTKYNIYGFVNTGEDVEPDDFAWAGKVEVLYKDTEIALSGWTQKDHKPIYGLDFSSGIASINVYGELSLSTEETLLRLEDNYSVSRIVYTWIPRASMGFFKDFDFRDVDSRIIFMGEFYYNHAGYSENIFKSDGKIMSMFRNDLFGFNTLSSWYGFLGGSYREFIRSDLDLFAGTNFNPIDKSFVIMSGLNFNPKENWTFDLTVMRMGGGFHSEYAFPLGKAYILTLVSKWAF